MIAYIASHHSIVLCLFIQSFFFQENTLLPQFQNIDAKKCTHWSGSVGSINASMLVCLVGILFCDCYKQWKVSSCISFSIPISRQRLELASNQ